MMRINGCRTRLLQSVSMPGVMAALLCISHAGSAAAQTNAPQDNAQIEEIVVTAQKRSERISDIGMSITAASGDALKSSGVRSINDFAKIDTSFTFGQSQSGTPNYTIRGIGYYDFALAAPPAVSAYVDEVPLAFSALTKGVTLDLERVEILKGPQGTLFGQNSTGGAINFIAAKPTSTLQGGLEASLGRFTAVNVNGFLSGPLTDTLKARAAFSTDAGGAWQKSYTRNDTLGNKRFLAGRLLLQWDPSSDVRISVNLNGWRDQSDPQAGQYIGVPLPQELTAPSANVPLAVQNAVLNYPLAPRNSRAADWGPTRPQGDEDFYQASLRAEYDLAPSTTLTSISAYSHYRVGTLYDQDGMAIENQTLQIVGHSRSFSQELRLAGKAIDSRLDWLLGGSYASDKTSDLQIVDLRGSNAPYAFVGVGAAPFSGLNNESNTRITTKAVFANVSYKITDHLSAHVGARYTDSKTEFSGCSLDNGDGSAAAGFNALQFVLKTFVLPNPAPYKPAVAGGCVTFDSTLTPGLVVRSLHENNLSWRAGLDWKVDRDILLYATVSKGYKAGAFGTSAFISAVATDPVVQESVMAYEAGFKTFLFDRTLQLDGAYFHYDYRNKQINGAVPEPIVFGTLFGLINIPKSKVDGFEISSLWRPLPGLSLSGDATYLRSQVIGDFVNVDRLNQTKNFKGEPFPFTPKWSLHGGAQYEWSLSDGANAYFGGDYSYRTSTQNGFGDLPYEHIKAYGLLDLRAGVRSSDGRIYGEIWGRNVTNTYYWNDATKVVNTATRRTGLPATYGIRVGYRFN